MSCLGQLNERKRSEIRLRSNRGIRGNLGEFYKRLLRFLMFVLL